MNLSAGNLPNEQSSVRWIKYSCQPIRGLKACFNPSVNFGKLPAQVVTVKREDLTLDVGHGVRARQKAISGKYFVQEDMSGGVGLALGV